ncbi:MAG TPA: aldo/keto reductase, partial [Terriglobales bacterium]
TARLPVEHSPRGGLMDRRKFMETMAVAGAASTAGNVLPKAFAQVTRENVAAIPRATTAGTLKGDMLYRELGSTGQQVSLVGLGGYHIGQKNLSEQDGIRIIHQAIDRGITFMDNSWDYNGGESEVRMGKALAQNGYRNKVFLMTKLDGRTKETAAQQLDESLKRLQTDHVDLIQHHEVIRFDDPDRIFAQGGAMEAVLEAKKAGKVRFIGFTGHKDPHIHLYMLRVAAKHGFHFDTVQMPLNVMDAHFRSFAQLVVPEAIKQKIGVLGMKSMGSGIILKSNTASATDCLHYAMNLPTSVVITGIDNDQVLNQAFEAAKSFHLMNQQQVAAILNKTREAAMNGRYELFKTSTHFDSTVHHPEWLGGESPEVQKLSENIA